MGAPAVMVRRQSRTGEPFPVSNNLNLPFSLPGRFYRGNLHTHSTRSDGRLEPEEVIGRYKEQGYDFLALTDHFMERFEYPERFKATPRPLGGFYDRNDLYTHKRQKDLVRGINAMYRYGERRELERHANRDVGGAEGERGAAPSGQEERHRGF